MKKLFLISVSMFVCFQLIAEKLPYTIMAPSGVFLREGPSRESKKIGSVLFGSIVYGEYSNCEDCPNPFRSFYTQPQLDTTIIDGIAGRWIKVQYYNLKGYVFSGYILPGHWIIQSEGGVNTDFRLMHSGYQNTALNYDPNLNWYVYDVQEGNCTLRKVDVDIQL